MEYLTDLDATTEQLFAGGLDVGDDQVQALDRAGCRRGDVLAEDDRASGPRRRELDDAPIVTMCEVSVEPPPETSVELLCAVDIRDGDDDNLELHIDSRGVGRVVIRFELCGHSALLYGSNRIPTPSLRNSGYGLPATSHAPSASPRRGFPYHGRSWSRRAPCRRA